MQRLPDTVLLVGENGEPVDFFINLEANVKRLFPKRYFTTQEELLCWELSGAPTFKDPVIRGDPWKSHQSKLNEPDHILPREDRRSYLENTSGRIVSDMKENPSEKELGEGSSL